MYKLQKPLYPSIEATHVQRLTDMASIPMNPANTDYQEYLKWLSEGNQPYPSDYVEPSNELSVEPLPAEGTV